MLFQARFCLHQVNTVFSNVSPPIRFPNQLEYIHIGCACDHTLFSFSCFSWHLPTTPIFPAYLQQRFWTAGLSRPIFSKGTISNRWLQTNRTFEPDRVLQNKFQGMKIASLGLAGGRSYDRTNSLRTPTMKESQLLREKTTSSIFLSTCSNAVHAQCH